MSESSSSDLPKSPLEELCDQKLQEFADLDEQEKREAAMQVRELCKKSSTDSKSSFFHISTRSPTSTDSGTRSETQYCTADLETTEVYTYTSTSIDEISSNDVSEQPRLFAEFLERFKRRDAQTQSLSERARRLRLFMTLMSAKEYLANKWRVLFKKDKPAAEESASEEAEGSNSALSKEGEDGSDSVPNELEDESISASLNELDEASNSAAGGSEGDDETSAAS